MTTKRTRPHPRSRRPSRRPSTSGQSNPRHHTSEQPGRAPEISPESTAPRIGFDDNPWALSTVFAGLPDAQKRDILYSVQVERLQALLWVHRPQAMRGNVAAGHLVVKITDQLARLLDFYP